MFLDNTQTIIQANAADIPLADESVHCCVTSPPYWSLRKYAGEQELDWPAVSYAPMPGLASLDVEPMRCALGLEPTPESFVAHLVLVFKEVYRVLRADGVAWVVIGDSYARQAGDDATRGMPNTGQARIFLNRLGREGMSNNIPPASLQQGDLVGIPARLQFALQGDGWIVRNDVCWNKVNPMPESVSGWMWERHRVKSTSTDHIEYEQSLQDYMARIGTDRVRASADLKDTRPPLTIDCPGCPTCDSTGGYVLRRGSWRHTRAHEIVLMCVKSMQYYANQEAVRDGLTASSGHIRQRTQDGGGSNISMAGHDYEHHTGLGEMKSNPAGRNPRSVLSVSSEPYSGAHYACFPTALIAPLIRATCPARCCPRCGAGWAAIIEKPDMSQRPTRADDAKTSVSDSIHISNGWAGYPKSAGQAYQTWRDENPDVVLGYRATCDCDVKHTYHTDDPYERCAVCNGPCQFTEPAQEGNCYVPGTVLDPFVGSGTVLSVCRELGLRGIGLDLSHSYLDEQAKVRAVVGSPSNALEGLPMFEGLFDGDGHLGE